MSTMLTSCETGAGILRQGFYSAIIVIVVIEV
jgi:hypothetical protein